MMILVYIEEWEEVEDRVRGGTKGRWGKGVLLLKSANSLDELCQELIDMDFDDLKAENPVNTTCYSIWTLEVNPDRCELTLSDNLLGGEGQAPSLTPEEIQELNKRRKDTTE